jgi:hypothetical protein
MEKKTAAVIDVVVRKPESQPNPAPRPERRPERRDAATPPCSPSPNVGQPNGSNGVVSPFDPEVSKRLPRNLEFKKIDDQTMNSGKYHINKKPPTTVDTRAVDRLLCLKPGTCYVLSDWMRLKGIIEIHNEWDRIRKNRKSCYHELQTRLKNTFKEMLAAFENIYAPYLCQESVYNTTVCKNRDKRVEPPRKPKSARKASDKPRSADKKDDEDADDDTEDDSEACGNEPEPHDAKPAKSAKRQTQTQQVKIKRQKTGKTSEIPIWAQGTVKTDGTSIVCISQIAIDATNPQHQLQPPTEPRSVAGAFGFQQHRPPPPSHYAQEYANAIPQTPTQTFQPPPPPHVFGYPCPCPECVTSAYTHYQRSMQPTHYPYFPTPFDYAPPPPAPDQQSFPPQEPQCVQCAPQPASEPQTNTRDTAESANLVEETKIVATAEEPRQQQQQPRQIPRAKRGGSTPHQKTRSKRIVKEEPKLDPEKCASGDADMFFPVDDMPMPPIDEETAMLLLNVREIKCDL